VMLRKIEDLVSQSAEDRLRNASQSLESELWVRVSGRSFFEPPTERPTRFSAKPTGI
jgi:hypothetical protein